MLMTGYELAAKAKDIAENYKTIYVLGCFGAPINSSTIDRYLNAYEYNRGREALLRSVCDKGYFGFDCVCLLKAILWGWKGDEKSSYGGAVYKSNGVGDISESAMLKLCSDVSGDFSSVEVGEMLHMPGHMGIYIGDGLAVECTPSFAGDVQITACNKSIPGYYTRNWTSHGKLPFIDYKGSGTSLPFRLIDGCNTHRAADQLIKYDSGESTGTNRWGTEVCINKYGRVISKPRYGAGNAVIPKGGCVLSGHGKASGWILDNVREGYSVAFENGGVVVIPTGDGYVAGENIPRATDQLVVYRNRSTTGTNQWGQEILCRADGSVMERRLWGVGNSPIPKCGFVLSGHGKAVEFLYPIKPGMKVKIQDHKAIVIK